jgi:quinol monooxygenase YgiN
MEIFFSVMGKIPLTDFFLLIEQWRSFPSYHKCIQSHHFCQCTQSLMNFDELKGERLTVTINIGSAINVACSLKE